MSSEENFQADRTHDRRFPRWPLAIAGGLLLLIAGGAAALKLMFPAERLRALVEPRLEAAVGRDVELGSVSLKVFPRIAVRLDDLAIANPPGFSDEPLLDLDALDLQMRLLPLLRREFELTEVRLIRPVVRYEISSRGVSNFAGLGAESAGLLRGDAVELANGSRATDVALAGFIAAQAEQERSDGRERLPLVISELAIRDGLVAYEDHRDRRHARIEIEGDMSLDPVPDAGRSFTSQGVLDARPVSARFSGSPFDTLVHRDVRIEYEILTDLAGDSAVISEARIAFGDLPLTVTGVVRGLTSQRTLDLVVESDEFELSEFGVSQLLIAYDISGTAQIESHVSGPASGGEAPRIEGQVALSGLSVATEELGLLVTEGAGTIEFDPDAHRLRSFTGQLLGRPFELLATQKLEGRRALDGHLSAGVDLKRLAELREGLPATDGEVSLDLGFHVTFSPSPEIAVTGPVTLTKISYQTESFAVPAQIREATIQLTGTGVSAEAIPVELGESDLTLAFTAPTALLNLLSGDVMDPPLAVEFTATSNRLDLGEIRVEEEEDVGYSDLLSARLAGREVDGRDPAEIAADRYELPLLPVSRARGHVTVARLVNPPTEARNVSFDVDVRNGMLRIQNVKGRLYGGRLTGDLSLDFTQGQTSFPLSYDLQLRGSRAGEFLTRWTRLGPALNGLVDFSIAGSTSLDEAFLPTLNLTEAKGRADFRDGSFQDFGVTHALIKQFNLDPKSISRFESFGGGYEIKDGAFLVDSWNIAAGELTGLITGAAGLGGALDLKLDLQVPPSVLERAGLVQGAGGLAGLLGQLAGDGEAIPISLGLGGTISNPVLQLDMEALQETLAERLQESGNELLKQLFKPKKN